MEESHTIVLASGAAKNVMSKSILEVPVETEIQEREGFQKKLEKNIKNCGQQEGSVRKSTWQVADVRRPCVSISHRHVHREGKDMTNKKERERNRCSERQRACAVCVGERRHCANQVHSPWTLTQSIKLQKSENKGSKCCMTATNQFFDVKRGDRGTQEQMRRTTKRGGRRDWKLTAESAQVSNIRDPGQPTTLRPCRSWCKFCTTWCEFVAQRSDAHGDLEEVQHVWIYYLFLGWK